MLRILLTLTTIGALFWSGNAHAARQYRCNGRVQYRPCEVSTAPAVTELGSLRKHPHARAAPGADQFALVEDVTFKQINKRDGVWRGLVRGNGTVELRLVLKSGGVVLDDRYMGRVTLENRSTTFAFRSVVPTTSNWAWDVRALSAASQASGPSL